MHLCIYTLFKSKFIVQRSLKFKNGKLVELGTEYMKHVYNALRVFDVNQKLVSVCIMLLKQTLGLESLNLFDIFDTLAK